MHRLASGAVVLAYLAGAAAGTQQLSGRGVPFEELPPPPGQPWAGAVPHLAVRATQPATDTFELPFRGRPPRSDLGGLSTSDDQFFVAFSEGAVRASPGQSGVRVQVTPVDPGALGPSPHGLQAVGNAYRLQVSYAPSARPVDSFAGDVKAGFSYSPAASTSLGDLSLVYSRDGRSWTRLETADAASVREATSRIPGPGYLLLTTAPAAAVIGDSPGARLRLLALALAAGLVLVAVLVVLRRRTRPPDRHQGPPAAAGPHRP